jgi:hypothetical protein
MVEKWRHFRDVIETAHLRGEKMPLLSKMSLFSLIFERGSEGA